MIRIGQFIFKDITLSTGAARVSLESPSLYTYDCVSSQSSTSIIKFASDTVVLGLISNNDETAYLEVIKQLANLQLTVNEPKELVCGIQTILLPK